MIRWMLMSVVVLTCLATAHAAAAATCTWRGGSLSRAWSTAANWDGCGGAHAIPQSGDDLTFPADGRGLTNINDIAGLRIGRIIIESRPDSAAQYVITGARIIVTNLLRYTGTTMGMSPAFLAPLAVDPNGDGMTIDYRFGGGPDPLVIGDLDLGGNGSNVLGYVSIVAAAGPILISGTITGSATGLLDKSGGFDLVLTGNNTFAGDVWGREGAIELRSSNALGMPGQIGQSGYTAIFYGTSVTLGPGVVVPEQFWLTANDTASMTMRVPAGQATLTGVIAGQNVDNLVLAVDSGATLDVQAPINLAYESFSAGTLTKRGAGTLLLANATNGPHANHWLTATLSEGVLRLSQHNAMPDESTLSTEPGTLFDVNGLTDTIGGLHTIAGTIALRAGTLTIAQPSFTTGILSGPITGTGRLVATGSGLIALGPSNIFNGSTTVTVEAPGTIVLPDNVQQSIGALTGTGSVRIAPGALLAVGGTNLSMTYAGALAGEGTFRKEGLGTATLTGTSSMTGTIEASAGRLLIDGTFPGTVALGAGRLGGTGRVGSVVATPQGGGIVAPGNGPGILSAGSVEFAPNTFFFVELNGTSPGTGYDQLKVDDYVVLYGATLQVSLGFTPPLFEAFTIVDVAAPGHTVGTFKGLPQDATLTIGGLLFRISYVGGSDGHDVVLTRLP
jgi:fibronectin-binding autotransporter adhesin